MLYENIKNIIDSRKQSVIATKQLSDDDAIDLIKYMLDQDAIIDRLVLTEGSLTKRGVDFIVKQYSHKLRELDISDNGLIDNDIEALMTLPSNSPLKVVSINNNFLSKEIISRIEKCSFEYLDTENQERLGFSETPIPSTHFTPQLSTLVRNNSVDLEVNVGKRKADELLLDSKYSDFLKEADPQQLEIFFQVLSENSSLKKKKQLRQ